MIEAFGYYCIIVAAFLAGSALKEYRFLALAVFAEFLLHKLTYNHLFLDFRSENKWFIYYVYAFIQLPIIYLLYKLKSHFVISGLMFINMIYNLSTPLAFINAEFIRIYFAKDYFIGTIMILELIYLGLLNGYVYRYRRKRGKPDFDYIDCLFRVRGWRGMGSLV